MATGLFGDQHGVEEAGPGPARGLGNSESERADLDQPGPELLVEAVFFGFADPVSARPGAEQPFECVPQKLLTRRPVDVRSSVPVPPAERTSSDRDGVRALLETARSRSTRGSTRERRRDPGGRLRERPEDSAPFYGLPNRTIENPPLGCIGNEDPDRRAPESRGRLAEKISPLAADAECRPEDRTRASLENAARLDHEARSDICHHSSRPRPYPISFRSDGHTQRSCAAGMCHRRQETAQ